MALYANAALLHNLPELPPFRSPVRPLRVALSIARDGNGRTTDGRGARRRSSYEHQLDRISELVDRAHLQGHVVALETGHGKRRRLHQVDVAELVSWALRSTQRWARDFARKVLAGIEWLDVNGPHARGWARRQSKRRAARDPRATRFHLPRRSWSTFTLYRALYDATVRLLLALRAWKERGDRLAAVTALAAQLAGRAGDDAPIPPPRASSPRPQAEERAREDRPTEQSGNAVQGSADDWRAVAARVGARHFTT